MDGVILVRGGVKGVCKKSLFGIGKHRKRDVACWKANR